MVMWNDVENLVNLGAVFTTAIMIFHITNMNSVILKRTLFKERHITAQ